MKYVIAELHPSNRPSILRKFDGKVFDNQQDVFDSLAPGETITVRKNSKGPAPRVYKAITISKPGPAATIPFKVKWPGCGHSGDYLRTATENEQELREHLLKGGCLACAIINHPATIDTSKSQYSRSDSSVKEIVYGPNEKTRWFSVSDGKNIRDMFLCKRHADGRVAIGNQLGIPAQGAACMMGLRQWPTGQEPCEDCGTRKSESPIVEALNTIAFLNMQTLKDRPELGCSIIEDAARMVGYRIDVSYKDGSYFAVLACNKCGVKNKVKLMGKNSTAVCGRCKEVL